MFDCICRMTSELKEPPSFTMRLRIALGSAKGILYLHTEADPPLSDLRVNAAFQSGVIFAVIDNRMGHYPSECLEKFMALALRCCQDETESRPSMLDVVRE
ncbi:hypothetical protein GIB67_005250 [Kingdonia uniflora]|uniref:Uncharacterized protein n=1 Tax=Kingdonia uniflora TaxID=39325 RepID=A0A7J7NNY6_9MAGN|nr:hypothetical protein GIB67_005250 [Kingdonia uniflora]